MSTTVTALRCEYAENPLGIDVERPRLGWQMVDDRRGACQSAWQVQCASSIEKLAAGQADLWDSGQVSDDRCTHVEYAGPELTSRQRAWWRVRVWDAAGEATAWSEPAWWEMGLLDKADWSARWIGSEVCGSAWVSTPCPFLRKGFTLAKPVAQARLYVTALGLYEFHLNGRKVGDQLLAPGWTDYRHRVRYQVYDVAEQLSAGENVAGAVLGDGWYCGHIEFRGRQRWGDRPRLLAQLEVTFADGTTQTLTTDESWRTATGPILEADLLQGEHHDARRELTGWDAAGYDDAAWKPVQTFEPPAAALVAMPGPPVRATQELTPVEGPGDYSRWSGIWIFDLGQNMVGRVRLRITGPAGTTVKLRFAEVLNPDGTLYTENLRSVRATDAYTLRGEGEEVWEPRFTFHGFRYVEVSGLPKDVTLTADAITGVVMHSDMPTTGTFECSDERVNQLQRNIVWGQRGNFLDVPTDCPQRDERLGWTGDAQVFIRTASWNMQVAGFFRKWLCDLTDCQSESGAYPATAPVTFGAGGDGGPGWADAGVICPWTLYLAYGDTRILREQYPGMRRYMAHLERKNAEGHGGWGGFGDWLNIDADTPKDLIAAAFYAYSAELMTRIAEVLGDADDAAHYREIHQRARAAFQHRFATPAGLVIGQTQTAYVLALAFDLLDESVRDEAVKQLVEHIRQRKMHLSTGFLGTPYLPHVLSRFGELDVAYALLMQTSWPSWLYPVTQGATTIWERWDGWTHDKGFQTPKMNSFNHYAYGAVGDWLYNTVAGVELDAERPGDRHAIIQPRPGGGLSWARGRIETLYGPLESHWRLTDGRFELDLTVPPNTTATVHVPTTDASAVTESGQPADRAQAVQPAGTGDGEAIYAVPAGRYSFVAPA